MQTIATTTGYAHLAALLDYPDESTAWRCRTWLSAWAGALPEAAERLQEWACWFDGAPLWQAQEAYTHTFDLQPTCSLDVGYHLFGEDYQRGLFLAHLRQSQHDAGMGDTGELPDHLPVILRWLERTAGSEEHRDMAVECLLPVLRKMDEALAPRTDDNGVTKGGQNPYRLVLQAVALAVEHDQSALEQEGLA